VHPSSFVSELSSSCPSSALSGSLPSTSSSDENIVTPLYALYSNTCKISKSSTLLHEARDVNAWNEVLVRNRRVKETRSNIQCFTCRFYCFPNETGTKFWDRILII